MGGTHALCTEGGSLAGSGAETSVLPGVMHWLAFVKQEFETGMNLTRAAWEIIIHIAYTRPAVDLTFHLGHLVE